MKGGDGAAAPSQKEGKGEKKRGKGHENLDLEEKYRIANTLTEKLEGEIVSLKKGNETNIDSLKALGEECEISMAESKRDAYEFRRDVVGTNNKIQAEKVFSGPSFSIIFLTGSSYREIYAILGARRSVLKYYTTSRRNYRKKTC